MKSVYVGNLSAGATEQTVRALFEVYGTVERVHIVADRETGQPKGVAFVEMVSDVEAEKAIASVKGQDSGGKTLTVSEAPSNKLASAMPTQSRGRIGNEGPPRPGR